MSSCDAHSTNVGSLEGQGCIGEHGSVGLTLEVTRLARLYRASPVERSGTKVDRNVRGGFDDMHKTQRTWFQGDCLHNSRL